MGLGGKKGGKKTHAVEPRFKELFIKFSQQPSRASRVRPSCFKRQYWCPELAHWTSSLCSQEWAKKSYIQFWFIAPHHLILSQDGSAHVSIWTMNKLGVLIACSSCGNQPTELTTDQKLLIGPPVDCCLIWKENRRNQRSQRFESFVLVLLVTDGLQKSSSMGVVWLCTFLMMHESIDLNFHFVLSLK